MTPLLATHIIASLLSLILAGVSYLAPTSLRLRVNYVLIALTTATGIYLIWTNPPHMVSSTISGLSYLAVVMTATYFARRKLAHSHDNA